jgi:hypothetical protein
MHRWPECSARNERRGTRRSSSASQQSGSEVQRSERATADPSTGSTRCVELRSGGQRWDVLLIPDPFAERLRKDEHPPRLQSAADPPATPYGVAEGFGDCPRTASWASILHSLRERFRLHKEGEAKVFVLSHPCGKTLQGWGAPHSFPGLRVQTWGTQSWSARCIARSRFFASLTPLRGAPGRGSQDDRG